jgi:hypothetical protein
MREITRRLRAVRSHRALDALTDDDLHELLNELTEESNKALFGEPVDLD